MMKRFGTAVLPGLAVVVFAAGSIVWTFGSVAALSEWLLPALSILALVLAIRFGTSWPGLSASLVPFAAMLIIGWLLVPHVDTALRHFAGASLGVLVMLLIPVFANSEGRLRVVLLAYLATALAVLIIGLAAADTSDPSPTNHDA